MAALRTEKRLKRSKSFEYFTEYFASRFHSAIPLCIYGLNFNQGKKNEIYQTL